GMGDQFKPVIQAAIGFYVGVVSPAVYHSQDFPGVFSALPCTIHLQLYTKILRATSIKGGTGLITVGMQRIAFLLVVAGGTIGCGAVFVMICVIGFVIMD